MKPTKYSPEISAVLCAAISRGVPITTACAACGIGESTFHAWVERHPAFADAVRKSAGEAESGLLDIIYRAAQTTWQAAAWLLERHPRYRERWAKPREDRQ